MPAQNDVTGVLDLCLRIGEMLLSNGAGAADVTFAMDSVARHYGLRNAEIDVTFTSLSMSYQPAEGEPAHTMIRQVKQRGIDYEDLTRVDHLIARILAGKESLRSARASILTLFSTGHHRRRWAVTSGWGVMAAGVALMLGGGAWVVGSALVTAMVIDRTQALLTRRRLPTFYQQAAGGAIATVGAVVVALFGVDGIDPSLVVTANIVMLLAGIGFMGALQDALSGFYVTAGARLLEVMLSTAGIIVGVSGGLAAAGVLGVDIGRMDPSPPGLVELALLGVGAGVAAAGFAYASYARVVVLLPVALVAAGATGLSRVVEELGFGRLWPVGLAAVGVGVVGYAVARRVHVPPLVVVVSAVVPLLPGLTIYRGLSLLGEGGVEASTQGIVAMVTAASIALALAAGVILGEYIAQPLAREARRLERRLSGPRLVGPLRSRPVRHPDS
ncbi:threonine/serine exporter family protein [Desertihabitans aurantiacus]|uniref:threonine/serine ThrE exporter family protein n=1 Tax=Desertihabitans aurantiacus TaxID=2282477 RepID=UPI001E573EC9|nr:threonine/serine exporter family protein [Desertihabitans aurantiacus]